MTPEDVEHLRVTTNTYIHHRHNHTTTLPDPQCIFCDDRLIDANRTADGVIYVGQEDER